MWDAVVVVLGSRSSGGRSCVRADDAGDGIAAGPSGLSVLPSASIPAVIGLSSLLSLMITLVAFFTEIAVCVFQSINTQTFVRNDGVKTPHNTDTADGACSLFADVLVRNHLFLESSLYVRYTLAHTTRTGTHVLVAVWTLTGVKIAKDPVMDPITGWNPNRFAMMVGDVYQRSNNLRLLENLLAKAACSAAAPPFSVCFVARPAIGRGVSRLLACLLGLLVRQQLSCVSNVD